VLLSDAVLQPETASRYSHVLDLSTPSWACDSPDALHLSSLAPSSKGWREANQASSSGGDISALEGGFLSFGNYYSVADLLCTYDLADMTLSQTKLLFLMNLNEMMAFLYIQQQKSHKHHFGCLNSPFSNTSDKTVGRDGVLGLAM
jgi:hypothetical protein